MKWTCPYCDRSQVVVQAQMSQNSVIIGIDNLAEGKVGFSLFSIGCANEDCSRLTTEITFRKVDLNNHPQRLNFNTNLRHWNLLPDGTAKPQPSYIPPPIVEDYVEACRIKTLSPKASATLSRRCLQGMIRDFCGISKARLIDEVVELKKRVDEGNAPPGVNIEAVDAIDHVRGIGNIGAHMEKNIDLIIPVDDQEAQLLIDLIETLFDEWYVARHVRQERLARIAAVAQEKKDAIAAGRLADRSGSAPESG